MRLSGWSMADAMAELRIWLDQNNYVPQKKVESKGDRALKG